jgi:hypothetical protein
MALARLVTGASRPEPSRSPIFSRSGRRRRWNEARLAPTQASRSTTRARASPDRLRRPVASSTRSSASEVNRSKSGSSESRWYDWLNGSRPETRTATLRASPQSTGSATRYFFGRG